MLGGGTAPAWANLTSTGGTIAYTVGSNSLNLEALSAAADSFVTDAGTAVPDAGSLSVLGGSNLNTSATGSTVFVNLNDSVSVTGSLSAGTAKLLLVRYDGDVSNLVVKLRQCVDSAVLPL